MSKVLCERMKGRPLVTAFGTFQFDSQGVADVPDEHVEKLLTLKGYREIGKEDEQPTETQQENAPDDQNDSENIQVGENASEEKNDQENDESNGEDVQVENTGGDDEDEETSADSQGVADDQKEVVTADTFEGKNVAQLKKIAKDNNIDLAGATKKDEIIPILIGAMNK